MSPASLIYQDISLSLCLSSVWSKKAQIKQTKNRPPNQLTERVPSAYVICLYTPYSFPFYFPYMRYITWKGRDICPPFKVRNKRQLMSITTFQMWQKSWSLFHYLFFFKSKQKLDWRKQARWHWDEWMFIFFFSLIK